MAKLLSPRTLLVLALVVAAGCAARAHGPVGAPGAPAPSAAVERFLQLAADGDYVQMGWVFGTSEGPVMEQWPVGEVEQRMYALATILRHDSFIVGTGAPVPGRVGAAQRFSVQLLRGDQRVAVPFTAVRGPGGRWFLEQVSVEAVTGR